MKNKILVLAVIGAIIGLVLWGRSERMGRLTIEGNLSIYKEQVKKESEAKLDSIAKMFEQKLLEEAAIDKLADEAFERILEEPKKRELIMIEYHEKVDSLSGLATHELDSIIQSQLR